jgi:hypothetical protein
MKKQTHLALAILLLVAAAAPAAEIRGIISRIDPARKDLVLDARGIGVRGTVLTFTLADSVSISDGTNALKATELAPGQHIRIVYEVRDGKNVITSIRTDRVIGNVLKALPALVPGGPAPGAPALPADHNMLPMPAKLPADSVTGTLRRVAFTEREIIVATPGEGGQEKYTVLSVPENVRVLRDGQPIKFEDLKENDQAIVRIEKRNGQQVAASIELGQQAQATVQSVTPASTSRITQLRMLLRVADQFLEQLEKQQPR